jgi:hypothetical protein
LFDSLELARNISLLFASGKKVFLSLGQDVPLEVELFSMVLVLLIQIRVCVLTAGINIPDKK